ATAILVPLAWRLARSWPGLRLLPRLLLAALLGVVLNQVLFTEGLARTSPAHSAVINAGIPTWTMVIATLCGQERLSLRRGGAIALAPTGVGCLLKVAQIGATGAGLATTVLVGDLLTLGNG